MKYQNADVFAFVLAFLALCGGINGLCIYWPILAAILTACLFVGWPILWLFLRLTVYKVTEDE